MIADTRPDTVIVTTVDATHHLYITRAMELGCDVITEKPMTTDAEKMRAIFDAIARTGWSLRVTFNYRDAPAYTVVRRLMMEGVVGRPLCVGSRGQPRHSRPRPRLLPPGAREERVRVPRHAGEPRSRPRTAPLSRVEMADGSLCTLAVTTGSAHEISRHRFSFAGLSAESNTETYRSSHDPWTFTGDTPTIDDRLREALAAFEPRPEGFAGQFSRYHQALQSGAELPVTLTAARASLELITAIYHSARRRAPVRAAARRHPSPVRRLAAPQALLTSRRPLHWTGR